MKEKNNLYSKIRKYDICMSREKPLLKMVNSIIFFRSVFFRSKCYFHSIFLRYTLFRVIEALAKNKHS